MAVKGLQQNLSAVLAHKMAVTRRIGGNFVHFLRQLGLGRVKVYYTDGWCCGEVDGAFMVGSKIKKTWDSRYIQEAKHGDRYGRKQSD